MFNMSGKDPTPLYKRDVQYRYKAFGLKAEVFPFYKAILKLNISTNMAQYAKAVEAFRRRGDQHLYTIKVCPELSWPAAVSKSNVYVDDLYPPISLFRYLGKNLFPKQFGNQNLTRANVKSPSNFSGTKNFATKEWRQYMAYVRQMAEEEFKLIFISEGNRERNANGESCPDRDLLQEQLKKSKDKNGHSEPLAIATLAEVASQSGILDELTIKTKKMIQENLPTLETLEEILAAILKLEESDIETRIQASIDVAREQQLQEFDAKMSEVEERNSKQLIDMHETINRLQDMIDKSYQQNELLLETQKQQSSQYESQLFGLLEKLKDES